MRVIRARGNSRQRSVVSEEARADVVVVSGVVVFVLLLFVASTDEKDEEAEGKGRKEVV
jgi:hypothetical protein